MSTFWLSMTVFAVIIVFVLAIYAFKLLRQLKLQTQQQENAEIERQKRLKEHDNKVLSSVIIIVRAMKEEQCDIAEGCWRLSVLLDSLKLSKQLDQEFPAIFKLYQSINHMPILEERKKLTKQERMKLDLERMKIESELADDVKANLVILHQYAQERTTALSE